MSGAAVSQRRLAEGLQALDLVGRAGDLVVVGPGEVASTGAARQTSNDAGLFRCAPSTGATTCAIVSRHAGPQRGHARWRRAATRAASFAISPSSLRMFAAAVSRARWRGVNLFGERASVEREVGVPGHRAQAPAVRAGASSSGSRSGRRLRLARCASPSP